MSKYSSNNMSLPQVAELGTSGSEEYKMDSPTGSGDKTQVGPKAGALDTNYIQGARLHAISFALCLTLFLTNLEIPIVSTSLVGITNDLGGFRQSSWIVTAYLLTYIGFLIIWAKMSDIFGRKPLVCLSIFLFVAFSGACGGAQTMTQLIVFRALQGFGGSGIYSLCMVIFFELVPPEKYAKYTSIVSGTFALSLLLGPILGGAINDGNAWRWVFLLNVPIAAVGGIVLAFCLPNGFPYHGKPNRGVSAKSSSTMKRIDFLGAFLLLAATILLVTGVEEAGIHYEWRSAFVITILTLSGVSWILFLAWSYVITKKNGVREPVFPWRFIQSRIWLSMLICGFCLGPPFSAGIFQIPQRYQVVNGLTPLEAGVRLLPFTFVCPMAAVVSSIIAGKAKVPPLYLVIFASCLQIIGFGLLTTIPNTREIVARQYGYEAIAGAGTGINISTLILMTPFSVPRQDQSVAMGSLNQFRYMGGAVGLAVMASVLNGYVGGRLTNILEPEQVSAILQQSSVSSSLPEELQAQVRDVFADGYTLQMKILVGMAAGQLPAALAMWQNPQIVV